MLLLFLHPCSAVSVGHGLTYVEMEKTLLVEQNYRKTAIRTKAICLWLYWQITHCGTGLAPSETRSQWSCPACRAGRHTDTPCSPVDWELVVHFGIPLLASWFPFFFFLPESAGMEGWDFIAWHLSQRGVREWPEHPSELRAVTQEVLLAPS